MNLAHDSIANYLTRQGIEGIDPGTTVRPIFQVGLTAPELKYLYRQDDLSRRIVDEIVDDALRGGFRVRDWDTNELVFEAQPRREDEEAQDFEVEDEPLDIPSVLDEVCKDARIYGTAHALIVNGDSDMSTPLDPQNAGEIFNLIPLNRWECTPLTYVTDPRNKRFARPETYYVTPNNNGGSAFSSPKVHYSRLLRFDGNKLPREMRLDNDDNNDSVLQVVWNALQRFLSTEQAIATIIQRFETATIEIGGLNEALTSDDDGHNLIQQRMDLIHRSMSMLNAALLDADAGERYNRQYATVTGLDVIWDRLAHSVAKAARMPMTQLFGMSPSGLSTDDEAGRANWRKQVASYQKAQLRPRLEYLFSIMNDGRRVYVEFPPLDESTAKESAEIEKLRAETEQIRVNMGVLAREEVREDLKDEGKVVDRPGMEPEDPAERELAMAEAQAKIAAESGPDEPENGDETPENDEDPPENGD